ncbi:MAG: hypothetical protein BroJett030_22370 [Alphaproteobacteria bacterium]|nr:MAG: hypothetical protein BroJett030_22370 [Alphaproteobacteria bacterium]
MAGKLVLAAVAGLLLAGPAAAQQPGTIITGESSVSVEGNSAATTGDATDTGTVVTEGSSNVFIGGKPAAVVGNATDCNGAIVTGSSSVFVNGKPLATTGSSVVACPGR